MQASLAFLVIKVYIGKWGAEIMNVAGETGRADSHYRQTAGLNYSIRAKLDYMSTWNSQKTDRVTKYE